MLTEKEIFDNWLKHIYLLHPLEIDLSLERVREVARRLNLLTPTSVVVTVAGTNGKGSTVAGLEAIYLQHGYRVGAFTTPFLFKHNETVRIQGTSVSDEIFNSAFSEVEIARAEIGLTPFEFNTLAALVIFQQQNLDVWLLEVGLGGRLDAVNIIDPTLAIITSIDLDHTDRLGATRELIALEKAGILRPNQTAVCGDIDPPISLLEFSKQQNVRLMCITRDFNYSTKKKLLNWNSQTQQFTDLPMPQLRIQNIASVLMAIELLQKKLPVDTNSIRRGISMVKLPARLQIIQDKCTIVLDVAHNPAAVKALADCLIENPTTGKTLAVFSMLDDKDIVSAVNRIKSCIDHWYVAEMESTRACRLSKLENILNNAAVNWKSFERLSLAYQEALNAATSDDRIIVFGSFYVISELALDLGGRVN